MTKRNQGFIQCDQCRIIDCRYKIQKRDQSRSGKVHLKCPKLPKSYEVWKFEITDVGDRNILIGRTPVYAQAVGAVKRLDEKGEVGFIVERRADGSS